MSLSSDEFEKAKEKFDALKQSMAQGLKIQKDMEKGLGGYAKALINIAEQQKNINYLEQQLAEDVAKVQKLKKEIADKEIANAKDIAMWQKLYQTGTAKIKALAEKKLDILTAQTNELKKQLDIEDNLVKNNEKYLVNQKKNLEITRQQAKEASGLLATWNSIGKLPGLTKKWGFDKMKSWGVFEMDKEIRNAARSMNVGAKDFDGFRKNIGKAADSTVVWGVNAKELAKMQQGYSEAIGRSVELTEDGHKAMALMAEGTGLGTEFAVQMASEMDKFGASAKTAKDLVAGTVKQAGRVGVNGAAASKKLVSLLKLSQTYVFKGGQDGLKKMASDAERLKLDLEGAAGMAEKVMRPEGAVETAALLTTMGGEFSKLGDPFQLMFKARNDFAGFAKDLGKASVEFVEFNKQTGAFDIKGGLARDRMLEISKITGVQMDKLQEMAVAEKKLQMIQGNIPAGITSEEDKELIASLTEVGKGGKLMIKLRGKDPLNIDQLTPKMLEKYKLEQNTLEESAKQARTFDEVIEDLIMSLKQTLLPFVQSLKDNLGKPLQRLMEDWNKNKFYDTLRGFAKGAGDIVTGIGKLILEWPKVSAALYLLFGPMKWFANGMALGKGFNMITGGRGGVGTGGGGAGTGSPSTFAMGGAASGRGGSGFGADYRSMAKGEGLGGKFRAAKYASSMNKWGTGAKVGAGIGLGAGAYALNSMRGDEGTNGYDSAGGKALGIGSSALSGAAMGMMLGPWGALAGGLIGGGIGAYNELTKPDAGPKPVYGMGDGVIKGNGKKGSGPGSVVKFNKQDKFMSVGDATIAGTSVGGIGKMADVLEKGKSGTKNVSGKIKHDHDIKVTLSPGSEFSNMLVNTLINNEQFLIPLATALNKSISAVKGGGKLPPKPRGNLN